MHDDNKLLRLSKSRLSAELFCIILLCTCHAETLLTMLKETSISPFKILKYIIKCGIFIVLSAYIREHSDIFEAYYYFRVSYMHEGKN